jgi:hypothetical protein
MKSFLQDVVAHTNSLGFLPLAKITTHADYIEVESQSEDRSVLMSGKTNGLVYGLHEGFVFGFPNLNKLDLHLKCPEYKKDAVITLTLEARDGEPTPTGLHFNNASGDFQNHYRFMNRSIIEEKVKTPKNKVQISYDIEFTPSSASITKLKFQAAAHTEETFFQVTTENNNLIFKFGDANSHAGSLVFQPNVPVGLKNTFAWSIPQVLSILNLDGNITMKISDMGMLQIVVESGVSVYTYTLPAQTK